MLYLSPSFPSLRKHSQACPETQVSQWFCLSPLSKPFKTFKKAVNTYPSRSTLYLFIHPDLQACPEFKAFALFAFNTLLLIPTPRCLSPSKKKAVSAICLSPLIQRVAYLSPSKKAVDCFTYLPKRRSMPFLSPFNTLLIAFKKKRNALNLCMSRLSSSPIGPALKYGTWKKREREIRLSSRTNL
jgi:hypothetical protein